MKKKFRVLIVTLCLLIAISLVIFHSCSSEKEIVSKRTIKKYVKTFISQYDEMNEYIMSASQKTNIPITENVSIISTVSKNNGVAIDFIFDDKKSFKFGETDKDIEEAILNNAGILMFPDSLRCQSRVIIRLGPGYLKNIRIDNSIYFKIAAGDVVYLDHFYSGDTLISNFTLAKGSNKAKDFSAGKAKNDAEFLFRLTISEEFVNSPEYSQYLAIPELQEVANKMSENQKNGIYRENSLLWEIHFKELHLIAPIYVF